MPIFLTCGANAVEVMTENPCGFARNIRGIGFGAADTMAMHSRATHTRDRGPPWPATATGRADKTTHRPLARTRRHPF